MGLLPIPAPRLTQGASRAGFWRAAGKHRSSNTVAYIHTLLRGTYTNICNPKKTISTAYCIPHTMRPWVGTLRHVCSALH